MSDESLSLDTLKAAAVAEAQAETTRAELAALMSSLSAAVIDALPFALVVIDETGRIVLVNAETVTLFGYPREQMIGKQVEMLLPERLRGGHKSHREGYLLEPRVRPMGMGQTLTGLHRRGAELPVEIMLALLPPNAQGMFSIALLRRAKKA